MIIEISRIRENCFHQKSSFYFSNLFIFQYLYYHENDFVMVSNLIFIKNCLFDFYHNLFSINDFKKSCHLHYNHRLSWLIISNLIFDFIKHKYLYFHYFYVHQNMSLLIYLFSRIVFLLILVSFYSYQKSSF